MLWLGPVLVLAVIVGVIAWMTLSGFRAARIRRDQLNALAIRIGWSFSPEEVDSQKQFDDSLPTPFPRGRAYNTLRGAISVGDRQFAAKMGDYCYSVTTGGSSNRSTTLYRFSYLGIALPFELPELTIRKERILDRVQSVTGFPDINFESAEFSRTFQVRCENKRFAYELVHPRMMKFLLDNCPQPIEIVHLGCYFADGDSRWSPSSFEVMLAWTEQFLELWPENLTTELER